MQSSFYTTKKRLLALTLSTIFIFLCIFFRLGYIQIVWGKNLQLKAADQWTRDLPLTALRGNIVDSNGVLLATSNTCYGVYVRAKNVKDAKYVAEILSSYLKVNYDTVYKKASTKTVSEATIKRQVSSEICEKIRSHNLDGVYFAAESEREYIYGDFLSQVLGFVSVDNVGQTGIEAYYDKYLKGINGTLLTQSDLIGRELSNSEMLYIPSVTGLEVVLTIDYAIQTIVENVLDIIMQGHNPLSAKCIVLDVTSGKILAMSSKPSFNLNEIPRDDVKTLMELSRNTLLTDIYEPGSTFKVLTAAANVEEWLQGNAKAFDVNHVFTNNSDTRYIDGGKIKCWTKHLNGKHSNQTLSLALNNSCNPIFTDIALSLGKDTIYKYLDSFGYGNTLGIDYLGEQNGILVPQNSVTIGDLARIGFGQTIAVTALQLCMATAAAVNGGYLYQPSLVKEIRDNVTGNTVKSFSSTVLSQPISSQASSIVAKMLEGVVSDGSGKQAYIEGYQVGGKTGTAQKYQDGRVAVGKNISSFVGFFPASSPKYLALVIVDEPVGVTYGSVVAAPYAKLIFQQIINYYNIAPIA